MSDLLRARGIDKVAAAAGWRASTTHPGYWEYPTPAGNIRYKAFDRTRKPKYLWKESQHESYYHTGNIAAAIAAAGGVVHLANGEPAVLAYHTAGLPNAISFYGESHVPQSFVTDLWSWGVTAVRMYPDKDNAGIAAAALVRDALQGSGIAFECFELPEYLDAKADTNDLWIWVKFDRQAFERALDNCRPLALPTPQKPRKQRVEAAGDDLRGKWWEREVLPTLERSHPIVKGHGKYQYRHCPNPNHDDKHPSFRISIDKDPAGLPVCTCGKISRADVAAWVGARDFRTWRNDEFPRQKPQNETYGVNVQGAPVDTPSGQSTPAATLEGAQRIDCRYVELPPMVGRSCFAVRSEVGTGKTRAAIDAARGESSVLYLTHREKLASTFADAAGRADVTFEHYKGLSRPDMRRASKLSICINTYAKLADQGLPKADLLIIDEFQQLLAHITSGETFARGEAVQAYQALEFAIRNCQRVLVMDAHLDPIGIDMLTAWRGHDGIKVLDNTFIPQRGEMNLYEDYSAALAVGFELAKEPGAPVAFAFASAGAAEAAAVEIRTAVDGDVLLITRDNAGGEAQRAFLRDPDSEAAHYKAIIYSPVLGTGIDINAACRAVVLIGAGHLDAFEHRQMMGRFRRAEVVHAFIPAGTGQLEEDQEALFDDALEKAEITSRILSRDGRIVPDETTAQLQHLRLYARLTARANASKNRRRGHFMELCQGYQHTISANAAENTLKASLQATREAVDQELRAISLTAPIMTREDYQRLADAGEVTKIVAAGWRRYEIERVSGLEVTPSLRDRLWKPAQRLQLRTMIDLLDEMGELKAYDAEERAQGVPIHRQRHRAAGRNVIVEFLNLCLKDDTAVTMQETDVNRLFGPLIARRELELKRLFGWRPDRAQRAITVVRRVLRAAGIDIVSTQKRLDGALVRHYALDVEAFNRQLELAETGLAARRERRIAADDIPLFQNCQTRINKGDGTFKTGADLEAQLEAMGGIAGIFAPTTRHATGSVLYPASEGG